jgi:hypothetical protein
MDAAADPPPHRRWLLRLFATFLSLLLLYVLSAGPAVALYNYRWIRALADGTGSGTPLPESFLLIYTPLFSTMRNTPLEQVFAGYTGWWTEFIFRLAGTPLPYPLSKPQ